MLVLRLRKKKELLNAKEISAKIQMNYHTLMLGYFMAQSCRKFDDLQKMANVAELDTENRVTITGELVHEKEYYSDWGCVLKGIFLLETGQKVFGSVPSMKDQPVNIGDVIQFDAKIEKPKDFDGTFYFFKRPTKARFISQVKEVA